MTGGEYAVVNDLLDMMMSLASVEKRGRREGGVTTSATQLCWYCKKVEGGEIRAVEVVSEYTDISDACTPTGSNLFLIVSEGSRQERGRADRINAKIDQIRTPNGLRTTPRRWLVCDA